MKKLIIMILLIAITTAIFADENLDQDKRLKNNITAITIGLLVLSIGLVAGNIAFVAGEPKPGIAILFVSISIGSIFAMMAAK